MLSSSHQQELKLESQLLERLRSQHHPLLLAAFEESGKYGAFILEPLECSLLERLLLPEPLPDFEQKLILFEMVKAYEALETAGLLCWGL